MRIKGYMQIWKLSPGISEFCCPTAPSPTFKYIFSYQATGSSINRHGAE